MAVSQPRSQSPTLVEKTIYDSSNYTQSTYEPTQVLKKKRKLDFSYIISAEQKTVELHCQEYYDNITSRRIFSKGLTYIELIFIEADEGDEDYGPVHHRRIIINPTGTARLDCMGKKVQTSIVFTKGQMFSLVLDDMVKYLKEPYMPCKGRPLDNLKVSQYHTDINGQAHSMSCEQIYISIHTGRPAKYVGCCEKCRKFQYRSNTRAKNESQEQRSSRKKSNSSTNIRYLSHTALNQRIRHSKIVRSNLRKKIRTLEKQLDKMKHEKLSQNIQPNSDSTI